MASKSVNGNFGPEADGIERSTCSSCGRAIIWAECDGKRIPLDPAPPVYIGGVPANGKPHAVRPRLLLRALGKANAFAAVSHFATCPNAAQHSRKSQRERSCRKCGLMHSEAECPGCAEKGGR